MGVLDADLDRAVGGPVAARTCPPPDPTTGCAVKSCHAVFQKTTRPFGERLRRRRLRSPFGNVGAGFSSVCDRIVHEPHRVAEPVHAHRDGGACREHHAGARERTGEARHREPGLEPCQQRGRAHRERDERDHPGRRLRALGGLLAELAVVLRERSVDVHRQQRARRADRPGPGRDDQLHPAAVERHEGHQPGGEPDQGAAAEGEVERRRERDQGGRRQHPRQHAAAGREPQREDDRDHAEGAEAVPVPDRLVQAAVAAAGVVHAEGARVEARDHAEGGDRGRRGDDPAGDRHATPAVCEQQQGRAARDVHEHEMRVMDRRRAVGRPQPRRRRPRAQGRPGRRR